MARAKRGQSAVKEERPEKVHTPQRVSLKDQARNVMTVLGRDKNREYRLVNDSGDRIQRFLMAGWIVEKDANLSIGDSTVLSAQNADGSANKVFTKSYDAAGKPIMAVLMSIDKKFYEEDQAAKEGEILQVEEHMTGDQQAKHDLDYVPKGGGIRKVRPRG